MDSEISLKLMLIGLPSNQMYLDSKILHCPTGDSTPLIRPLVHFRRGDLIRGGTTVVDLPVHDSSHIFSVDLSLGSH